MILSDESTGILSTLVSTDLLALAAGTGALITGGIYAAFPIMVLPALDHLRPGGATEVMRAINVAAERPPFLALFFGTAAAAVAAAGSAVLNPEAHKAMAGPALAGAGFAVAAFALTLVVNVPMNRRFATIEDPGDAWAPYRRRWGAANGVRALMSIAGGFLLLAAL